MLNKTLLLTGGRMIENNGHNHWSDDNDLNTPDIINDIKTSDIDISLFIENPFANTFKKMTEYHVHSKLVDDHQLMVEQTESIHSESQHSLVISEQSSEQSLESDNHFTDLSQLIADSLHHSPPPSEPEPMDMMVAPNDILDSSCYATQTTMSSIVTAMPSIYENMDSLHTDVSQHSVMSSSLAPVMSTIDMSALFDSQTHASQTNHMSSETLSSQSPHHSMHSSYDNRSNPSPNLIYLKPVSPTSSYTSNNTTDSQTFFVASPQSDSNVTDISGEEMVMDTKHNFEPYLQPTVINDHLYTRPSSPSPKQSTKDNKYLSIRKKNNVASKKSRVSKREKQKQMDEKIAFYTEDNRKCHEMIGRMEKEIEWCKSFLFAKVRQSTQK